MEGFLNQRQILHAEAKVCHLWGKSQGDGSCPPLPRSLRVTVVCSDSLLEEERLWEAGWSGAVGGPAIREAEVMLPCGSSGSPQSQGAWLWSADWNRERTLSSSLWPCYPGTDPSCHKLPYGHWQSSSVLLSSFCTRTMNGKAGCPTL